MNIGMMTPNKHKSNGVLEDNFTLGHISKYFVLSYHFTFAKTRPKYDIGCTLGPIQFTHLS